ncbi:hypothetical protein [Pseudoalteromonas obscura]|uniref:Orphan protein n=1 Tax=Pseudoalteromonas obscura TaxID=3048491 RepID=A0ABT7EDV4_9GAMM|nr:hypothetical protein [Pseudoalteromonas sp. P94(2023)]MDK2593458.1 hypothetical protein [Pseudoalteromonas sp. P94(2023)]
MNKLYSTILVLCSFFSYAKCIAKEEYYSHETPPLHTLDGGCIGGEFEKIKSKLSFQRKLFPIKVCSRKHNLPIKEKFIEFDSSVKESEIKYITNLLQQIGIVNKSYGYQSDVFIFELLFKREHDFEHGNSEGSLINISVHERWGSKKRVLIQYERKSKNILIELLVNGLKVEELSFNQLMIN